MSLFGDYWDIAAYLILSAVWIAAWAKSRNPKSRATQDERALGAEVFGSFISNSMTAASILVPAAFVIVQLGFDNPKVPPTVLSEIARSFYWFAWSVFLGIVNASYLPEMTNKVNVTKSKLTNTLGALQLFAIMFGIARLVVGMMMLGSAGGF